MALRVDARWPSTGAGWQPRTITSTVNLQARTSTTSATLPAQPVQPVRPTCIRVDRPAGHTPRTTRRLLRRRAPAAPPVYSYRPPKPVSETEAAWAPAKRWPSRVAPAGLLLALGMGVGGFFMAQPGKTGPTFGTGEDALAMRLPYEPSQLPAVPVGEWANGLPSEAMPWVGPIQQIAEAEGLDPRLLASVVWVESRFDPHAVSPKGAVGLAQVMPDTAKMLGIRLKDPLENLAGGAHYLKINIERFGRVELALAAYNGGPTLTAASRTLSRIPHEETRTYVTRVLDTYRALGGVR